MANTHIGAAYHTYLIEYFKMVFLKYGTTHLQLHFSMRLHAWKS